MERIQKLPFLAGCLAAIITGAASYAAGVESRMIYLRMAVMMLVFFLVGMYTRNTVLSITEDIEQKKREQELERIQAQENQKEEQKAAAHGSKKPQEPQQPSAAPAHPQTPRLDLVADDSDDDFKPFDVSKAVKAKVNE